MYSPVPPAGDIAVKTAADDFFFFDMKTVDVAVRGVFQSGRLRGEQNGKIMGGAGKDLPIRISIQMEPTSFPSMKI